MTSNEFRGKGSSNVHQPQEKCPKCHEHHVYYIGSSVMHGNPYSAAADTEVAFYFQCKNCGKEWEEYA